MPDKVIGEAAEATAEEGGAVVLVPNEAAEEAEHSEEAPATADTPLLAPDHQVLHDRLTIAEARLQALEEGHARHESELGSRARTDHNHPLPGHVQTVADALAEIDAEETAPVRQRWYERKILGRGR